MVDTLWKGSPIKFIHNIIQGHDNNTLHGKHDGILGWEIHNNKGVFRGIPVSALLYIIFADGIMKEYKQELIAQKPEKIQHEHQEPKHGDGMAELPDQ